MNLCIYQNVEKRLGRFNEHHSRRACTIAFLSRVKQHVGQKIRQKSIVIRFPAAIVTVSAAIGNILFKLSVFFLRLDVGNLRR